MKDPLCLDPNYSTTRMLFKIVGDECLDEHGRIKEECKWNINNSEFNIKNSKLIGNPEDKFEMVLFLPEGEGRKGEGGLRTKGYFKKSHEGIPLITVITVVYNGAKYLEETIQSVINQTYDNVEYIIIDGGSTDGTLDIIKKYEDYIDYWVSEPDSGIYDAMNKGIDLASGEWINFMNSGDRFYDVEVLDKVFAKNKFENIDVIYGNTNVIYPNKTRIAKAGDMNNLWKGMQFSHQSSFIKLSNHKIDKFNDKYKIAADFDFFYRLSLNDKVFKYLDAVIVNQLAGGVADTKRIDCLVESWNIIDKNNRRNFYYIWRILLEIFKDWIKRIIGHYQKQNEEY